MSARHPRAYAVALAALALAVPGVAAEAAPLAHAAPATPLVRAAATADFGMGYRTTGTPGQVLVTWSSAQRPARGWDFGRDGVDATGYGAWHTDPALPGGTTQHVLGDLKPGVDYHATLRNLDTGATQTLTVRLGGSSTPKPAPAPAATAVQTGPHTAELRWSSATSPASWTVSRDGVDTTGYGAWSGQIPGSARSHVFTELRTGDTYTFTAVASSGARYTARLTVAATATPTPKPTPGQAVGRRSGLPFDQGVFAHDPERVKRFEATVGRKVDVYQVAPQRDEGFAEMLSETRRIMGYVPAGAKVDLAVPLVSYDEARQLGQVLQATGHGDAYVRPGWEFNMVGSSWPWGMDRIGAATFKARFVEAARGFRAAAPGVRMEWNPNLNSGGVARAVQAYPGDAWVDVVGVDAYDWQGEDSWNGSGDLEDWLAFARQHGKKMSLPEWGVHSGKDGRGDDPAYVSRMLRWVADHRDTVVMASYFDETDGYIRNSIADGQVPRSAAAYRQALTQIR